MHFNSVNLKRILILGDDAFTLQALRHPLEQAGFTIFTSSMASDATWTAIEWAPHLVLIDIANADLIGIYLHERLRHNDPTRGIPTLFLIDKEVEEKVRTALGGSFDYFIKPIDPHKLLAFIRSYLPDLSREMDVNTLTGWPGESWIEHELLRRVIQKRPFALLNLDINNFRPFRRIYGTARGEQAVRLVAQILGEAVSLFGNQDDFISHVDEDDFYVITSPDRAIAICRRIISKFDENVKGLYRHEDVVRGYVECEYQPGHVRKYPIMTLSIGVTSSENQYSDNPLAIKRAAYEVRERAKDEGRSSFCFDQRGQGLILEGSSRNGRRQNGKSVSLCRSARFQQERAALTQFIGGQLRVPVTVVKSTVEYLLQGSLMNLTVEQRAHLDVLEKHTRHLSDVISQLVTFNNVHQNEFPHDLQVVDLTTTVAKVVEIAKDIAAGKMVNVEVYGAENVSRVVVDEQKLSQALLYTLYALIEYSLPELSVKIDIGQTEAHVRITLIVSGLNLPEGELSRLFRSFYCPRKLTGPSHGSIGLGFYLARQLANSIGGVMTARRQGKKMSIGFDFPKVWQSVDERARAIQEEIKKTAFQAKTEIDRIGAVLADGEEKPEQVPAILGPLELLIDQLTLQANRTIALLDHTMRRLADESERAMALDAELSVFLETLVDLLERRDGYYIGHSKRVAATALELGRSLALSEDELRRLYYAGLLHDVGMIAVSDEIIGKSCQLSEGEALILQQHAVIGARVISAVEALVPLAEPVLHHHEKYNGSGYPLGLRGEAIPVASRILAVADAYDAMIFGRPYRKPVPTSLAVKKIVEASGTQFDPAVVLAFHRLNSDGACGSGNRLKQ